jgi:hypothetical protein
MIEIFAAVQDALLRSVVPVVQMKPEALPKLATPWYLPEPTAQKPDLAKGRAQVAALVARYPRNMRTRKEGS